MSDDEVKNYPQNPSDSANESQTGAQASDVASTKMMQEVHSSTSQNKSETWSAVAQQTMETTNLAAIKEPDPADPKNPLKGTINADNGCPLKNANSTELMKMMGKVSSDLFGYSQNRPNVSQENDKIPQGKDNNGSQEKAPQKAPEGKDKLTQPKDSTKLSDRSYTKEEQDAIDKYASTIEKSVGGPEKAKELAEQTMNRLKDKGDHIKGSPAQQLERLSVAANDILNPELKKDSQGNSLRGDNQIDPLTGKDRENLVADMAHRFADPSKYVNQGQHMTCALESMQNQNLQAGDPAKQAEMMRDIVNKGKTSVTEYSETGNGRTREVTVDPRSYAPDGESGRKFDQGVHGKNGQRACFGHVGDALYGQMAADLLAERKGEPKGTYVYMAAHADSLGAKNGQTSTGEGLFRKNNDGSYKIISDSPGVGIWEVAHLSKAMGGKDGAFFVHEKFSGGSQPPAGFPPDLKINTFTNPQEFKQKLADWEAKTGQPAQLGVNANFLRGGGREGHAGHAVVVSKKGIDNSWGDGADENGKDMTEAEIAAATNPDEWKRGGAPGGGSSRRDVTPGNPGVEPGSDAPTKTGGATRDGEQDNQKANDADTSKKNKDEDKQPNDKLDEHFKQLREMLARMKFEVALSQWQARKSQATARGERFAEAQPQEITS